MAFGAGRFGRSTLVNWSASVSIRLIAPAPSTRSSAGRAAGPWPRITDTNELRVRASTARSVTATCGRIGAEHRRDLLGEVVDVGRAGRAAVGLRAEIERVDLSRDRVGGVHHAVRTKPERTDGLKLGTGRGDGGRRSGRRVRRQGHERENSGDPDS